MINKLLDEPYWDEFLDILPKGVDLITDQEVQSALKSVSHMFVIDVIKIMINEPARYNYSFCSKEIKGFIENEGIGFIKEKLGEYVLSRSYPGSTTQPNVDYTGERFSLKTFFKETQDIQKLLDTAAMYLLTEKMWRDSEC